MTTTTEPTTTPTPEPAPALYAVSEEWEENGYHDSDFYRMVYNASTGNLARYCTGSTRFAMDYSQRREFVLPAQVPEEVWRIVEAMVADIITERMVNEERRRVMEPEPSLAGHGTRLRLLRDVQTKEHGKIPAGTVGEVFWSGQFGTFYRNGYKRRDRSNTRVGLRLTNGTRIFAPLGACRLDRDEVPAEEIRQRALAIAARREFSRIR